MDDSVDWRDQLPLEDRQENLKIIMKTLMKCNFGVNEERLLELQKFAQRFEETTYATATSQSHYREKISSKMLSLENASDWRIPLNSKVRRRLVNKIMDTLKKHFPISDVRDIAQTFEERVFNAATSQHDYLRKIALKMLTMDAKYANSTPLNSTDNESKRSVVIITNGEYYNFIQSSSSTDLMPTNHWKPNKSVEPTIPANSDWRIQLQPELRQKIVIKIMETLSRCLPFYGGEGLHDIPKIAQNFEEKIYAMATSQSDYLRKIAPKMLTMEIMGRNSISHPIASNSASNKNTPI